MPLVKSTYVGAKKKPCRRRKLVPSNMYKKIKESEASVFDSLYSSNIKQLKSSNNSEKENRIATRQKQSSKTRNEDIKPNIYFHFASSDSSTSFNTTFDQLLRGPKFQPLKPRNVDTTNVSTESSNCCSSSNISSSTLFKASPLPATRKYNTRLRAAKPTSSFPRKNIILKTRKKNGTLSCVENINKSEFPQRVENCPVDLIPECKGPTLENHSEEQVYLYALETENSDLLNKDVLDASVFDCVEASKPVGTPSFRPHKISCTSTPKEDMPNFDFVLRNKKCVSVMNDNGRESLKNCSNKETPVFGDNTAINEQNRSCHFGTQYQHTSQTSCLSEDIFKSYENNGLSSLGHSPYTIGPDTAAMKDVHPASCSLNKLSPFQNDTPSHSEVGRSEHDNVTSITTAAEYVSETPSKEGVKYLRLRSRNIKIQKNKQLSFDNYLSKSGENENALNSVSYDLTYKCNNSNSLHLPKKNYDSSSHSGYRYNYLGSDLKDRSEGTFSCIKDRNELTLQNKEEPINKTKTEGFSDNTKSHCELLQPNPPSILASHETFSSCRSSINQLNLSSLSSNTNKQKKATKSCQNELFGVTKSEITNVSVFNDSDSKVFLGLSDSELIEGSSCYPVYVMSNNNLSDCIERSEITSTKKEILSEIQMHNTASKSTHNELVHIEGGEEVGDESRNSEENLSESDIPLKQLLHKEQSKIKDDDLKNNSVQRFGLKKSAEADNVTTRRNHRRYTRHIILDNLCTFEQSRKSILRKAVEYSSRSSLMNRPSTINHSSVPNHSSIMNRSSTVNENTLKTRSSALTCLPVFQNVEEECEEKEDDQVVPSVPLSDDLDSEDDQRKDADDTTHEMELPRKSSNFYGESSKYFAETIDEVDSTIESEIGETELYSPEEIILQKCQQNSIVPFPKQFPLRWLKKCKKIGEGTFAEVFCYKDDNRTSVFKIMPVEGDQVVNGEPQKKYMEILPEILISLELSSLRKGELNKTDRFAEVIQCICVKGRYPRKLICLWDEYAELNGTENDSPTMFDDDQVFIVLELAHGGTDLEKYYFNTAEQAVSVFIQITYALAVAENSVQFEHRDLHWGNILISETDDKTVAFSLNGDKYNVPTKGVLVTIIDFTLSRMTYEGCFIFTNLSTDETLFGGQGDYQFDMYRIMRDLIKDDDWSRYVPRTNVFWLHYILHKMRMSRGVHYKSVHSRTHRTGLEKLDRFYNEILSFESAVDIVKNLLN